jgi:hypothetical protein
VPVAGIRVETGAAEYSLIKRRILQKIADLSRKK